MDPVTLGLIANGVGGAFKIGADLFDDTASRQANQLRQQAQLKLSSLEENMRRAEGQQTQVLSSTKARMAGTGFSSDSGSFSNYITTMATQFDAQNKFQETEGHKSVDMMLKAADDMESGGLFSKVFRATTDLLGTGASLAGLLKPSGGGSVPGPSYGP